MERTWAVAVGALLLVGMPAATGAAPAPMEPRAPESGLNGGCDGIEVPVTGWCIRCPPHCPEPREVE